MLKIHRYLVAGRYAWDRAAYKKICKLSGQWHYTQYPFMMTRENLAKINPKYIFLLHWSKIIPNEVFNKYICVGFHMTDLPYGRGGTPLQNLILRGYTATKLTAFRITSKLDAGPIYLKENLSLRGTAHQIYARASLLAVTMIKQMIANKVSPRAQDGPVVHFNRRKVLDSRIGYQPSLRRLYDFIRMLDAPGYPNAYLLNHEYQPVYRFEFTGAKLKRASVEAKVKITCES